MTCNGLSATCNGVTCNGVARKGLQGDALTSDRWESDVEISRDLYGSTY